MKFKLLRKLFGSSAAEPLAATDVSPSAPAEQAAEIPGFTKRLVVFDFQGTLDLAGKPNLALHLFAALAKKKGHDVIIATGGDPDRAATTIMFSHAPQMNLELPFYTIISKYTARADIQKMGYQNADIVIDNDPHMIPSYINVAPAKIGAVDLRGHVSNLEELASLLEIKEELAEMLQKLNKTTVPAATLDVGLPK